MEHCEIVDAHEGAHRDPVRCRVNDSFVDIGSADNDFEWHAHDTEDKFFYVVEGRFQIDLEERTVELVPKQGFTVPKGVVHRTRVAAQPTVMLTIGSASCKAAAMSLSGAVIG